MTYLKVDTIKMDNKILKLLSEPYLSGGKFIFDIEGGKTIGYFEMMNKEAKVISYEKRFKNF